MPLILEKNIDQKIFIGVWHCTESMDELLQNFSLTEDDKLEIDKTKLVKRKIEKTITRKLAKQLLETYFEKAYHGLKKSETGKPILLGNKIEMSVSHCESYLTVLLSTYDKAGIDIQNINPKIKTVSTRVFSQNEIDQINDIDLLYARAWSAKEAMFKYYEKGNINFIEDLHLSDIADLEKFKGTLKCNNEFIVVKFGSIQVDKLYQIVYCHEN